MSRRRSTVLLCTCALALAACGDDAEDGIEGPPDPGGAAATQPAPAAEAPATTTPSSESCLAASEGEKDLPCPTDVIGQGDAGTVVFTTSRGSFTVKLDTDRAPLTANSFAYLARARFYDGLDFHRVADGFVIQGGDPNGDGSGGSGYKVTEAPPSDLTYDEGVVAMAKAGAEAPGTSGSQFFVVLGDSGLPPEYALVGTISKGLGTVKRIAATGEAGQDGPPAEKTTIESARFARG